MMSRKFQYEALGCVMEIESLGANFNIAHMSFEDLLELRRIIAAFDTLYDTIRDREKSTDSIAETV